MGGSPGLVVKGGGCEFESQCQILDGHFSHWLVVKIVMFDWSDWNKRKRGRVRPIFNKDSKFVFRVVMSDSLLFRYIRLFSNRKYFSANKYRDSNSQHLYHETPTITPTRQIRTLAFIARMFRKYLINICTKLFPFQFRLSRDVWIRPTGLNKKWKSTIRIVLNPTNSFWPKTGYHILTRDSKNLLRMDQPACQGKLSAFVTK